MNDAGSARRHGRRSALAATVHDPEGRFLPGPRRLKASLWAVFDGFGYCPPRQPTALSFLSWKRIWAREPVRTFRPWDLMLVVLVMTADAVLDPAALVAWEGAGR